MSIRRTAARIAPAGLVRWFGRLQFQWPALQPLIRWAAAGTTRGESVIRHGIGRGLKFDSAGGNPGFALGTSNAEEQQLLADHLHAGHVFYDIGANVGFFTTLAARLVGPAGFVYGFEPFPASAAAAQANAERNHFKNVRIFEAAASNREGEGAFVLSGSSISFHLRGSGDRPTDGEKPNEIPVRVVTIDALVSRGELRPPNAVMIDVEGAELDVLEGMAETLREHRPIVICEVHWIAVERFLGKVHELLGSDVYVVASLDGSPLPTAIERYHVMMTPRKTAALPLIRQTA